jgi:hypothetical protein
MQCASRIPNNVTAQSRGSASAAVNETFPGTAPPLGQGAINTLVWMRVISASLSNEIDENDWRMRSILNKAIELSEELFWN